MARRWISWSKQRSGRGDGTVAAAGDAAVVEAVSGQVTRGPGQASGTTVVHADRAGWRGSRWGTTGAGAKATDDRHCSRGLGRGVRLAKDWAGMSYGIGRLADWAFVEAHRLVFSGQFCRRLRVASSQTTF